MNDHLKAVTDGAAMKLITALESGRTDTFQAYLRAMGRLHRPSEASRPRQGAMHRTGPY